MDELAAAAGVLAVATDSESEEEVEQPASCVAAGRDEGGSPADVEMVEDKENKDVEAARGQPGDADPQVTDAPRVAIPTPCAPPITPPDCTCTHPSWQASVALCTEIAFGMFPEGKGAPKAVPKVGVLRG